MKGVYQYAIRLFRKGDQGEERYIHLMPSPYYGKVEANDGWEAKEVADKVAFGFKAGYFFGTGGARTVMGVVITAPDGTEYEGVQCDIPPHLVSPEKAAELARRVFISVAKGIDPVDWVALVKAARVHIPAQGAA